jgi:hypothetical protein
VPPEAVPSHVRVGDRVLVNVTPTIGMSPVSVLFPDFTSLIFVFNHTFRPAQASDWVGAVCGARGWTERQRRAFCRPQTGRCWCDLDYQLCELHTAHPLIALLVPQRVTRTASTWASATSSAQSTMASLCAGRTWLTSSPHEYALNGFSRLRFFSSIVFCCRQARPGARPRKVWGHHLQSTIPKANSVVMVWTEVCSCCCL